MPEGDDHQVSATVRVTVHHHEGGFSFVQYKVIVSQGILTENAPAGLLPPDVFAAPGRIDSFHKFHSSYQPDYSHNLEKDKFYLVKCF